MADDIRFYEKELQQYRIILDAENPDEMFRKAGVTPLVAAPEGKRKCIIMLALSFFSGRGEGRTNPIHISRYEYSVEGREEKEYSGRYQLEVIPRYIIKELKDSQIDDIEFIVLETKQVRQPQDNQEIWVDEHQCKTVTENGSERNPSEAEFFISRTLRYIANELKGKVDVKNVKFVEYCLSDIPRTDMSRLMDLVRKESGAENGTGQNADIYIDIHGGPRGTQQLLINLLSILGEEGIIIDPRHILTVDVGEAPIKVAGESFRVNDFVSGIHEFTNYGRMKSLDTFYEKRPSKPEELLAAMRNVSYAIQVCDMATFEPALVKLAEKLTDFKANGDRNDYLYSFMNLLVQGYDPLIKPEGDGYVADTDPREEIRWCKKKGLYQQMLTLCESKIPAFLSTYPENNAVLQYDPGLIEEGEEKHGNYELYNFMFNRTINAVVKEAQPTDGVYRANMEKFPTQYELELNNSEVLTDLIQMHFELKDLRNHSNHGSTNGQGDASSTNESPGTDVQKQTTQHTDFVKDENPEKYLTELVDKYLGRIEDAIKLQTDDSDYPGQQRKIFLNKDTLSEEVQKLRKYITNHDNYVSGHDAELTNERLKRAYRLIGELSAITSVEERLHVLNDRDSSTVREIYNIWYAAKDNILSYEEWLNTKFLTTSNNLWKTFGKSLGSCYNKPSFLYRLADAVDIENAASTSDAEDGVDNEGTSYSADGSLEQEVQALATYLKNNYESISTADAPQLTNQKLQELYKTLCAAEPYCDKSNNEKENAIKNCDISLLAHVSCQGNAGGRTDKEWAKTALKNKNSHPYWINIGNKLQDGLTKGWLMGQL